MPNHFCRGLRFTLHNYPLLFMTEKKMVEEKSKLSSHWWWFDSQSNSVPRKSPWLQSALAELDEKTESMLKLIEEDADSFAKRAEMYYKKRPELINIVEDFYRSHRSLAERYDQVKFDSGSGSRHLTPWTSCPLPLSKYRTSQLMRDAEKSYDSYSESFDFDPDEDSVESEVDDPEHEEDAAPVNEEIEKPEVSSEAKNEEVMNLREEIDRLKEENKLQKEQLIQKDEEKREAIRQLSFSVNLLKEENVKLKSIIAKDKESPKKQSSKNSSPFEFSKFKGVVWGKLFNGKAIVPL